MFRYRLNSGGSSQGAFDKEGIFMGDASYLFVPDNLNYEGSVKLLFDESDHPVSEETYKKTITDQVRLLKNAQFWSRKVSPAKGAILWGHLIWRYSSKTIP